MASRTSDEHGRASGISPVIDCHQWHGALFMAAKVQKMDATPMSPLAYASVCAWLSGSHERRPLPPMYALESQSNQLSFYLSFA